MDGSVTGCCKLGWALRETGVTVVFRSIQPPFDNPSIAYHGCKRARSNAEISRDPTK